VSQIPRSRGRGWGEGGQGAGDLDLQPGSDGAVRRDPGVVHPALDAVSYVTRIPVRVSDTIRIGYVDTHFPKKHQYRDTVRIINNYI